MRDTVLQYARTRRPAATGRGQRELHVRQHSGYLAAHGNGDMLLLAAFTARLTPFNTNAELDAVLEMGTLGAARSLGFENEHGVAVGKRADLMVLEAPTPHEAVLNQSRRLWVIKGGRVVASDGRLLEDA